MKVKLSITIVSVTLLLLVLTTAVMAQGEPPAPYAGLKNPFPWDDTSVQEAGKGIYQRFCLGCHGIDGSNIATADFTTPERSKSLEERPDFYFWVVSEGRMGQGMPSFKSSLSEEERWQVLTYLRSLAAVAPPEAIPPAKAEAEGVAGSLRLVVSAPAQSGQPLTLSVRLQDKAGKPIQNATVKFFVETNFFINGRAEIGEAVTDDKGAAVFEYLVRQSGELKIIASYQTIEATATLTSAEPEEPLYEAKAGLSAPSSGDLVFVGPESALDLGEKSSAPMSALRIPGSLRSLLFLSFVFIVILVWGTYFRVFYQVLRIPITGETADTNTRLVPLVGLVIVTVIGLLLVLILITGPYTHLELPR